MNRFSRRYFPKREASVLSNKHAALEVQHQQLEENVLNWPVTCKVPTTWKAFFSSPLNETRLNSSITAVSLSRILVTISEKNQVLFL